MTLEERIEILKKMVEREGDMFDYYTEDGNSCYARDHFQNKRTLELVIKILTDDEYAEREKYLLCINLR